MPGCYGIKEVAWGTFGTMQAESIRLKLTTEKTFIRRQHQLFGITYCRILSFFGFFVPWGEIRGIG